mmetsp:Transcript_9658/g.19469  ORF Transcript_9658/g.19469 Transcript_9658/m.19469 type:complete len:273 (-) Transcript_9658:128-946(-)
MRGLPHSAQDRRAPRLPLQRVRPGADVHAGDVVLHHALLLHRVLVHDDAPVLGRGTDHDASRPLPQPHPASHPPLPVRADQQAHGADAQTHLHVHLALPTAFCGGLCDAAPAGQVRGPAGAAGQGRRQHVRGALRLCRPEEHLPRRPKLPRGELAGDHPEPEPAVRGAPDRDQAAAQATSDPVLLEAVHHHLRRQARGLRREHPGAGPPRTSHVSQAQDHWSAQDGQHCVGLASGWTGGVEQQRGLFRGEGRGAHRRHAGGSHLCALLHQTH